MLTDFFTKRNRKEHSKYLFFQKKRVLKTICNYQYVIIKVQHSILLGVKIKT